MLQGGGEHQFWDKQPLVKQEPIAEEGFVLDPAHPPPIFAQPVNLPAGFNWCTVDLQVGSELDDLYCLLKEHYVEDSSGLFKLHYTKEILKWAMAGPKNLLLGVRVEKTGKLVAFIAILPLELRLRGSNEPIAGTMVNFLCVHRKLRHKRLSPQLFKEATRRLLLQYQMALFTTGVRLDDPVCSVRYHSRPLNFAKLVEARLMAVPPGRTVERWAKHYSLGKRVSLPGWRTVQVADIAQIKQLMSEKARSYALAPDFTEAQWQHLLLGSTEVHSYAVCNEKGQITDFVSWYSLESQVVASPGDYIRQAYLFYYHASEGRLEQLIRDALVTARDLGFHAFNCTNIMQNPTFFNSLNFLPTDGDLHYYLFNYRLAALSADQVGLAII